MAGVHDRAQLQDCCKRDAARQGRKVIKDVYPPTVSTVSTIMIVETVSAMTDHGHTQHHD